VDVTGMESRRCDDVIRPANPPWPVNRWLTAMVRLFRPQIEWRIRQRDDVVADWAARYPDIDVFEDRNLELTRNRGDDRRTTRLRTQGVGPPVKQQLRSQQFDSREVS
jgi:hypothetical protein